MRKFLSILLFIPVIAAGQNNSICTSNRAEIEAQIENLKESYGKRINSLTRENGMANLKAVADYGSGRSWPIQQENNRKYNSLIADVRLQRDVAIADLSSRIVEVCDVEKDRSENSSRAINIVETLSKLTELFESGLLSEEEFQKAKRTALGLD